MKFYKKSFLNYTFYKYIYIHIYIYIYIYLFIYLFIYRMYSLKKIFCKVSYKLKYKNLKCPSHILKQAWPRGEGNVPSLRAAASSRLSSLATRYRVQGVREERRVERAARRGGTFSSRAPWTPTRPGLY